MNHIKSADDLHSPTHHKGMQYCNDMGIRQGLRCCRKLSAMDDFIVAASIQGWPVLESLMVEKTMMVLVNQRVYLCSVGRF